MKFFVFSSAAIGILVLGDIGFAQVTLTPPPRIAPSVPVHVTKIQPVVPPPSVTVSRLNRVVAPQTRVTAQQLRFQPVTRAGGNRYIATYPYPLVRTPANEAWVSINGGSVYDNAALQTRNGGLRAPTAKIRSSPDLIRLDNDPRNSQTLLSQRPAGPGRYNFQFSNNEVRSVQQALRRLGYYAGPTDGDLSAETQRAIEVYQVRNNLPVTGMPSRPLYAELGIVD